MIYPEYGEPEPFVQSIKQIPSIYLWESLVSGAELPQITDLVAPRFMEGKKSLLTEGLKECGPPTKKGFYWLYEGEENLGRIRCFKDGYVMVIPKDYGAPYLIYRMPKEKADE